MNNISHIQKDKSSSSSCRHQHRSSISSVICLVSSLGSVWEKPDIWRVLQALHVSRTITKLKHTANVRLVKTDGDISNSEEDPRDVWWRLNSRWRLGQGSVLVQPVGSETVERTRLHRDTLSASVHLLSQIECLQHSESCVNTQMHVSSLHIFKQRDSFIQACIMRLPGDVNPLT